MGIEIKTASTELNLLNKAVSKGEHASVSRLLEANPTVANQYLAITYESPLANALMQKPLDYTMLEILVKANVAFDYPINHHKELPLEWACKNHDVDLVRFLMKHQAPVSERTAHFLLAQGTNIKFLSAEHLIKACQIIDSLGGLDAVSTNKNAQRATFENRAKGSQLINASGGVLKYNYMDLLKQAYHVRNISPESEPSIQIQYKTLRDVIEKIRAKYSEKQERDSEKLKDAISLYFMTGKENPTLRDVEDIAQNGFVA